MRAVTNGTLDKTEVKFKNENAACVVMASKGYPQKYESGFELKIDPSVKDSVYVAGAKKDNGKLLTAGGRVLGVTATADTLENAINKAYEKVVEVELGNGSVVVGVGAIRLS